MYHKNLPLKKPHIALAVAVALSSLAACAHADSLQDLKAQVDVLLKKVAEIEQKQTKTEAVRSAPLPANAVTGGATKGSSYFPQLTRPNVPQT